MRIDNFILRASYRLDFDGTIDALASADLENGSPTPGFYLRHYQDQNLFEMFCTKEVADPVFEATFLAWVRPALTAYETVAAKQIGNLYQLASEEIFNSAQADSFWLRFDLELLCRDFDRARGRPDWVETAELSLSPFLARPYLHWLYNGRTFSAAKATIGLGQAYLPAADGRLYRTGLHPLLAATLDQFLEDQEDLLTTIYGFFMPRS
jgi:hypothetical protein